MTSLAFLLSLAVVATAPAALHLPANPVAESPLASVPADDPALPSVSVPELRQRLEALSPSKPADYFLLGEEVAAEITDRAGLDLARRLYVLAFELERAATEAGTPPPTPSLGPSVCRALAALARPEGEKRWLAALALRLTPDAPTEPGAARPAHADAKEVSDQTALELATALGFVRSGEGRKATSLLARPGVREALESYEAVLAGRGDVNPIQRMERYISQWPTCPECRGKHVITRNQGGTATTTLCTTCGGLPGPRLTEAESLGYLRMESSLLRGIHRLWSAQLLADDAQPLRDPNPDDLAPTYRVDPELSIYKDGRWSKPATKPVAPPSGSPAAQGQTPPGK